MAIRLILLFTIHPWNTKSLNREDKSNDTLLCHLQILMSRDHLLKVTFASTRWICHINFCNGFDLLNLFSDNDLHMLSVMLHTTLTNQHHMHDSEGDSFQTLSCSERAFSKDNFERYSSNDMFDSEEASSEIDSNFNT